ncbi:MAG: ribonuclease H-like domain-containing protein, partial [Myxococcaceae bacterium]
MIRNTFQLIPGVGPWREKDLWARGVREWSHFPPPEDGICISAEGDVRARKRLVEAEAAFAARNLAALSKLIPPREHWRLYDMFPEEAAFFDIETDGKEHLRPTVVSVFDQEGLHVFIKDRNMDELPARLGRSAIWVTFNGTCFDVPVLERHYADLP